MGLETSGDSVSVGSPSVVYDGLTERVSLSSLSEDTGIMCYTLSSSSLMCRAVSIVPTTTTSTATVSSTSETLTASETSSTTASTNSLPSTLTSTTPHTTTETFTTTSPHTTTVTSFTQTSVTELSGSHRSSVSCFLLV